MTQDCLTAADGVDHRWLDKGAHIVVARLAHTAVGAQSVDALRVLGTQSPRCDEGAQIRT